jgi:DNA-binding NarL/FixJ family response regulator
LKRILVVQSKRILAEGILHLLNRESDLKVFDTTCDDVVALIQQIQDIKPAVLVMEGCIQLTYHPTFISLLGGYPDMRVIVIDEQKNRMYLFKIQEIEILQSADLVTTIREDGQFPSVGNLNQAL